MTDLEDLHRAGLEGEATAALSAARAALETGHDPLDLVNMAIAPAMAAAGELFEEGEYFVPELLMAARATKGVFEILRPLLAEQGKKPVGRIILGTVEGDLHDIGKNLVGALLEGGGFEVVDLGVSVKSSQFVQALEQQPADLVGVSALLTTTMPAMKATLEALRVSNLRGSFKVMVGGAPVTRAYADSIGADGYAENAAAAVALARQLLGK
jgi:5-methyltetrahydrofolate--homocysteine methyltransferase